MAPRQRYLGQSQHIDHNLAAEGQVLAVMVAQADHKPLREEAMASGYGSTRVRTYAITILGNIAFTYWPLGQSAPRGQYPERYS